MSCSSLVPPSVSAIRASLPVSGVGPASVVSTTSSSSANKSGSTANRRPSRNASRLPCTATPLSLMARSMLSEVTGRSPRW